MKKILYLFVLVFGFTSCEDVVDIDVPSATPRLVIDATIYSSAEETIAENTIKLHLTSNFFEEQQQPVTNAIVTIIDQTNAVNYSFENLDNSANYTSSSFTPEFNTNYKLQVIYNNNTYESVIEQVTPTAVLSPLEQGNGTLFGEDEIEVIIEYQDEANRDDYYFFDLSYDNYLTSKDEFYQGNLFSFSYYYEDLNAGDEVVVALQGINERYYNYMNILLEQSQDSGNPFGTTPTTVKGNIVNTTNTDDYPVGYFRLSEVSKQSLVVE